MTKVIKGQIEYLNLHSKVIVWSLFSSLIILILAYAFLLQNTIFTVVKTQDIEKKTKNLVAEVGQLEASYVEAKKYLTLEQALTKGFVEIKDQKFVSRAVPTRNVTMRNEI